MRIGAHVATEDPLTAAQERGAEIVQFFLTDPQTWVSPPASIAGHELSELGEKLRDADITAVIHAPYIVNLASPNNRIRIPSRKLVAAHAKAAAALGAIGLVVHGGHVTKDADPAEGIDNWRKAFVQAEQTGGFGVPIFIENTAGGTGAMARHFDRLAQLWDVIGEFGPGFCLDTCHAHAAGEDLSTVVQRATDVTGRIDLVHVNNSKDAFDSGRDRHDNLDHGQIDLAQLCAVVSAADAPAVVETPGGAAGQAADIALLKERRT